MDIDLHFSDLFSATALINGYNYSNNLVFLIIDLYGISMDTRFYPFFD